MFKPIQFMFLIEEVSIYTSLLLAPEDISYPGLYLSEESLDFFCKLRHNICDIFIEQNRKNLNRLVSCPEIDYLFLRGLADISDRYIFPAYSYYSFSDLITDCNKLYEEWSKSADRSPIVNYKKMTELLADSSLKSHQCDKPISNISYKAKVLDKVPGNNFHTEVYKVKSLGELFYLLFSQCSKLKPLKKCRTCNSYYLKSNHTLYCSDKCQENDTCIKNYNKLYNRYIHNPTKYEKELDILHNLRSSWSEREIDNETFLQHMKKLQKK